MKTEKQLEFLAEHVAANAGAVERLAWIVIDALPHTRASVTEMMVEWNDISKDINKEYGVEAKP